MTALERAYPALAAMETPRRRAVAARRSHRSPTSTCSIASACSSSASSRRSCAISPRCKIVLEHITTRGGRRRSSRGAARTSPPRSRRSTCVYSRNALFAGGLRPHLYCLPVLKRETHRQALVAAATSGSPKFFLGTDSRAACARTPRKTRAAAPAATPRRSRSSSTRRCSRTAGALDRLEGFASVHGAASTDCRATRDTVTLEREPGAVPADYPFGERSRRAAARGRNPWRGDVQ